MKRQHRKHQVLIQTDTCTQIFVVCGDQTDELLRNRVFSSLRHICRKIKPNNIRKYIIIITARYSPLLDYGPPLH
jgi:hypothetical protein